MQEKASAEIRGEFFRTKSRVNFAGDFLVDFFFFWPFSLEKIGGKKIHQKIHGKIQIGIWEFRGQNPHCRNLALLNFARISLEFSDFHQNFLFHRCPLEGCPLGASQKVWAANIHHLQWHQKHLRNYPPFFVQNGVSNSFLLSHVHLLAPPPPLGLPLWPTLQEEQSN